MKVLAVSLGVALALIASPANACRLNDCYNDCYEQIPVSYARWYGVYETTCVKENPGAYEFCKQYANEMAWQKAYAEYEACREGCYGRYQEIPELGGEIPPIPPAPAPAPAPAV